MDTSVKFETAETPATPVPTDSASNRSKNKSSEGDGSSAQKRRCVSTACLACRRRKSKCDGNLPKCAACASVYLTDCEYAPHTDHRRKGVYKKDADSVKTKDSTLQILIQAILNYEEEEAFDLVREIRSCDSLESLAQLVEAKSRGEIEDFVPDSPIYRDEPAEPFEAELSGRMGDLLLDGSIKFVGGTSNLIWLTQEDEPQPGRAVANARNVVKPSEEAILSWTTIIQDKDEILHLMNMYFCWHYSYFTTLSKELFYRDFLTGTLSQYCSPLLVNVMLSLGCHFSARSSARADPEDSSTTGDHFFSEAKRLLYANDEFADAKLCTVQALALMSVREAGCGRESKGWVYSGMSFRMACDLGLNIDAPAMSESSRLGDEDVDARRITFWGCFLFDKCWSNYLGRQPQLQMADITVRKPNVFPSEESEVWSPYTDAGVVSAHSQPARTRAVALEISKLAEISSDILVSFYNPQLLEKSLSKQAELKKLSDLHTRLEIWKKESPHEMEPGDGSLPQVLLMHMFFQLLYIHLYRPFLKYTRATSPLPAHVSPRRFCTQAAAAISKLLRLYKRTYGLRQICNIAVYIAHSACTIHLLNLPEKNAKRDIVHGVKHLEEIGEYWLCARRTLRVLETCATKWKIEMPEDVSATFQRTKTRWSVVESAPSPVLSRTLDPMVNEMQRQSVSDLMAKNVQHQMRQARTTTNIGQMQTGLTQPPAMSPASTIDDRRSSGGMSLPPHSAADFGKGVHKNRPSTILTKQQQEAWNAHKARLAAVTGTSSSSATPVVDANVLFGGVETLMEEPQEWYFKDQSQLATGFDNWTPVSDWSSLNNMGYDFNAMDTSPNPPHNAFAFPNGMAQNGIPTSQPGDILVDAYSNGNLSTKAMPARHWSMDFY